MAYKHGVYVSEMPTSVLPPTSVSAGLPFVVGTAPVNMADETNVNKPVLCASYEEAVAAFGYVPPTAAGALRKHEFTLSEFIRSHFGLFGVGPCVLVNVLDPAEHKTTATTTAVTLTANGEATVAETGLLPSSVVLSNGDTTYKAGEDYELSFDTDGHLVIIAARTESGFAIPANTELTLAADKLNPSAVTADDIVGGVDTAGNKSGLELIDECFPRFRLAPGLLLAPGYSSSPTVAAVLAAKAANINQHFEAVALIDVPTDTVKQHAAVAEWKTTNNIVDPLQVACWPMLALDGVAYNLSTQMAGAIGVTDAANDDVPYVSPSNHALQMTAAVLADGTEVWLSPDTAAALNGQGVVTALNFIGGWKCWGNRTACYPGNTDAKDSFIPVRRMFGWVKNTLVQTFWQKLDGPINKRLIDTIVDSANMWLNGLAARQYILGGRVEFLSSENSQVDLLDGKLTFHVYLTPPTPAREINFVLEFDANYMETLFS